MDIQKIINNFRKLRILVVGDLILDHYIWGKVNRISPEAPVPVVDVNKETFLLGGAANVAHNVVALGGKAAVVGIRGKDIAGEVITGMLEERGVDCSGIFTEQRPTTVKTRVIAHHQQVVRFDREDRAYVDGKLYRSLMDHIRQQLALSDAVIISDYRKGMVSKELVSGIVRAARQKKVFVAVDPKVGHFNFYRGVSLITPNLAEASNGAGIEIVDDRSLVSAGKKLLKSLACASVLVTRGEHGMSLFRKAGVTHVPTVAKKVYDVTGAGDTVISTFTLAYAAGASMEDAVVIANHAAGFVVGEVGTAVATAEDLLRSFGALS